MKDMDLIFPLIPYGLLLVKWFGFHCLSKSSNVSKCSKVLEMGIFSKQLNPYFEDTFFQNSEKEKG